MSVTTPKGLRTPMLGTEEAKARKKWSARACLDDHVEVFRSLPKILGAYVGPNSLSAQLGESIMVAANSENNCPYCEGLHGELARMACVEGSAKLQAATSAAECTDVVDDPAVFFARTFAEGNGHGDAVDSAFEQVVTAHGQGAAGSVLALCWFLAWGSLGGNTLNAALFQCKCSPFGFAFAIYYAPLFAVIKLLNMILARMGKMPAVFFKVIGVTLTFAGGIWLTPMALLGMACRLSLLILLLCWSAVKALQQNHCSSGQSAL